MKVRASAGAASFRRKKTLKECLAEAEEQVKALRAELETDPAAASKRQQAARERAARERIERINRALEQMSAVEDKKKSAEKEKARVSTTDADARVMKMADGGSEGDLQGAGGNRRVCQRDCPQPRPSTVPRPGQPEGEGGNFVVCSGAQPNANGGVARES